MTFFINFKMMTLPLISRVERENFSSHFRTIILIDCFQKQQQDISALLAQPPVPHDSTSRDQTSLSPPKSKLMDYYNNAKLKDIIC
jgi:hypothetical protein